MRADRLLSLLMFLQNRGRTTTDRLAEALEVSRRTIIRDLYALRVAGFPVYTERGPQGGVYLHEEFRVRLTDLTQGELAALFTFSVPAPLADLGMGETAKGALLKLAAALPQARQDVERDVRSRLYLDPDPWHASRTVLPTLSLLRQAVWENRWVHATVLRIGMIPIEHEIAPYGLVAKGQVWYVVWSKRGGELRVDLASVTLCATPEALSELERAFGRQIQRRGKSKRTSRWLEVEMLFDNLEHARATLLSYGGAVEVLEPEALRLSIADFAQRVVETYAG